MSEVPQRVPTVCFRGERSIIFWLLQVPECIYGQRRPDLPINLHGPKGTFTVNKHILIA